LSEQQLVDFQVVKGVGVFINVTNSQNLSFRLKVIEFVDLANCQWLGPINRNSQGLGPKDPLRKTARDGTPEPMT